MVEPQKTFETETIAVVSTAHVSPKDMDVLNSMIGENIPPQPFICLEYDCGVWVRTFWEPDEAEEREINIADAMEMGLSFEAASLIRAVAEKGYTWIKLDRDGPTYDGYEVFDWI